MRRKNKLFAGEILMLLGNCKFESFRKCTIQIMSLIWLQFIVPTYNNNYQYLILALNRLLGALGEGIIMHAQKLKLYYV